MRLRYRQSIVICLILLLAVSCFDGKPIAIIHAASQTETSPVTFRVKSNTYQILSKSDKTAALIKTTQMTGDFIVPSKVTYQKTAYKIIQVGGTYKKVTGLDRDSDSYYTYYIGSFSDKEFGSITIPNSVTKIADYCFNGISNLKEITINSNTITIGKYAISNISGIMFKERTLTINAKKVILKEGALSASLMTGIIINADQLSVGNYALAYAPAGITLPQGTTSIGAHAFEGCTGSFTIPKDVKVIGDGAFYKMKLTLAEGNSYFKISKGVLYNKKGTELIRAFSVSGKFTIPRAVTSMREYAFAYSKVSNVTTSEKMKTIPDYSFYQCPSLTTLTLTKGITSIGNYAYAYNSRMTELTLPDTLLVIGDYAFAFSKKLSGLSLPDSLQSIGTSAFENTSVSAVIIPKSVTSIGKRAFGLYPGSSAASVSLTFEEENPVYEQEGHVVYQKGTPVILMMLLDASSEEIRLPEGVTQIGDINLINLKPEMKLIIPASVTALDTRIFSYYSDPEDMGTVQFEGSIPPILTFHKNTIFHINAAVPAAAAESYQKAFSGIQSRDLQTVNITGYED